MSAAAHRSRAGYTLWLGGLALLAIGVSIPGCRAGRERPPNVLFVVVDTLRADRLGAYGNTRGLTPFLDGLARRGVVFLKAYAASSWTVPSVASLFTSRYPSQHHVTTFTARLPEAEVTFAERLQEARYLSGGFSANLRLLQRLGFGQGFQHWQSDSKVESGLGGTQLRSQSLAWLDATWQRSSSQPAFLYLQYMEPHHPYEPPEPFRSRFATNADGSVIDSRAEYLKHMNVFVPGQPFTPDQVPPFRLLYDGEVATVDEEIRLLFAELERRGFLDDAVIIITADHGEEFAEHGGMQHGRTLYNESIHVPLIVVAPGLAAGQRIEEPVSLVDVGPALLELLGLAAEPRFEGHSRLALMRDGTLDRPAGGDSPPVEAFFELQPHGYLSVLVHQRGMIRDLIKILVRADGSRESYDLTADPGESAPDPPHIEERASGLAQAVEHISASLGRAAGRPVEGEALDEATKEQLRALGYHF